MPHAIQINSTSGLMLIHFLTCHRQERPHPQRHHYHKTNIPISTRILTVIRTNHRLVYQLLRKAHHNYNHNHKTNSLSLSTRSAGTTTQQQPLQTSPPPPSTVQPQQSQSATVPSMTNPYSTATTPTTKPIFFLANKRSLNIPTNHSSNHNRHNHLQQDNLQSRHL